MRTKNQVVGLNLLGVLSRCRLGLGILDGAKPAGDLGDDLAHDLVLDQEYIGHLAIEFVGPNVGASLGVDELRRDAEVVASAPHATLKQIAHAELTPELGNVYRRALVLEGRIAREHTQVARPRQLGQDVLGQAVTEILLICVPAQVDEGEDRDPWTLGHACRGGLDRSLGRRHPTVAVKPCANRAQDQDQRQGRHGDLPLHPALRPRARRRWLGSRRARGRRGLASQMFLTCCSPRKSNPKESLPSTAS